MLLVGYMEGIDSERGIAWRVADSLSLREFLGLGLSEQTPDHSTVSRTRRLYSVETHKAEFRWLLQVLSSKGLVDGQTLAIA
jgi:transposase